MSSTHYLSGGEAIRILRSRRGLKQRELAAASRVSVSTVAKFEIGDQDLKLANFLKFCSVLDADITLSDHGLTMHIGCHDPIIPR